MSALAVVWKGFAAAMVDAFDENMQLQDSIVHDDVVVQELHAARHSTVSILHHFCVKTAGAAQGFTTK